MHICMCVCVWGTLRIQAIPYNILDGSIEKKTEFLRVVARAKRKELANELILLRLLFVTTFIHKTVQFY